MDTQELRLGDAREEGLGPDGARFWTLAAPGEPGTSARTAGLQLVERLRRVVGTDLHGDAGLFLGFDDLTWAATGPTLLVDDDVVEADARAERAADDRERVAYRVRVHTVDGPIDLFRGVAVTLHPRRA
ncbi:hypothetical protein [Nocardioides sp.]|uniref:hypothetical protein n=1 Tax=Nocardioides sp. TaxID=35761 RepID=UPI0035187AB5